MMSWIQRRPLIAALAVVLVALVVAIGFETGFGTQLRHAIPQEASRKAAAPEARLLPPVVAAAPEQAYPETTARPLFTPTRRPAPPENVAAKPAFSRGQFVLQGVIVVGQEKTALLKEKASGKVHRVESGKDLNGITVERIDPTEVTLAMGGEKEKIALVTQKAQPGAGSKAGLPQATFAPPPDSGPFGSIAPRQPPPGALPTAEAAAAQAAAAQAAAAAAARNPAARPVARSAPGAIPGANTPSSQPMTPEELLARRRARRNQPTQ